MNSFEGDDSNNGESYDNGNDDAETDGDGDGEKEGDGKVDGEGTGIHPSLGMETRVSLGTETGPHSLWVIWPEINVLPFLPSPLPALNLPRHNLVLMDFVALRLEMIP